MTWWFKVGFKWWNSSLETPSESFWPLKTLFVTFNTQPVTFQPPSQNFPILRNPASLFVTSNTLLIILSLLNPPQRFFFLFRPQQPFFVTWNPLKISHVPLNPPNSFPCPFMSHFTPLPSLPSLQAPLPIFPYI